MLQKADGEDAGGYNNILRVNGGAESNTREQSHESQGILENPKLNFFQYEFNPKYVNNGLGRLVIPGSSVYEVTTLNSLFPKKV